MRANLKNIGFWHDLHCPSLPHPREFVDPSWNAAERAVVLAYLKTRKGRTVTGRRGSSRCRICDCSNGSEDFSDGVYLWPSGYAHYVEVHHVKPPQAFIEHVVAGQR